LAVPHTGATMNIGLLEYIAIGLTILALGLAFAITSIQPPFSCHFPTSGCNWDDSRRPVAQLERDWTAEGGALRGVR
jgi:hypothetical protein